MISSGGQVIRACSGGAAKYAIDILDSCGFVRARCLTLKNLPFVIAFKENKVPKGKTSDAKQLIEFDSD